LTESGRGYPIPIGQYYIARLDIEIPVLRPGINSSAATNTVMREVADAALLNFQGHIAHCVLMETQLEHGPLSRVSVLAIARKCGFVDGVHGTPDRHWPNPPMAVGSCINSRREYDDAYALGVILEAGLVELAHSFASGRVETHWGYGHTLRKAWDEAMEMGIAVPLYHMIRSHMIATLSLNVAMDWMDTVVEMYVAKQPVTCCWGCAGPMGAGEWDLAGLQVMTLGELLGRPTSVGLRVVAAAVERHLANTSATKQSINAAIEVAKAAVMPLFLPEHAVLVSKWARGFARLFVGDCEEEGF
jgi:hypothetical protein